MKKLKFNSTLNHKQNEYRPCEISVEKVVELGKNYFESLIKTGLRDDKLVSKYKELMYMEGSTAHCVLFVNSDTGDGLLVESEGFNYPRKSQFIPNAKALIESNEQTQAEKNLHSSISEIADKIAELAHCGEKHFTLEDIVKDREIDFKCIMRDAVTEMLRSREDIQMAESHTLDTPLQPDISVKPKPIQTLAFYCPLRIVKSREPDWDEVYDEEPELLEPHRAIGCEKEINDFIQNFAEPEEEHRGLMVYYDDPVMNEKVFSAFPSVKVVDGELMGVFECKVCSELTDIELDELRSYLEGQASDGAGESLEQRPIKTHDHGEIFVSFWNETDDWFLQTEEEMSQEQGLDMKM